MLALLLIPVLVAGFVACHVHPLYFYKLHRYEGQYLYLKSAELGLKCFLIAISISVFLHEFVPDKTLVCGYELNFQLAAWVAQKMEMMGAIAGSQATRVAWTFQLVVLTFISAWILRVWGYFVLASRFGGWSKKRRWQIRAGVIGSLLEDSPLDRMLFDLSFKKNELAVLCMKDRSVYAGKVVSLGEPSEFEGMDQDIRVVPFLIGYQDKDTLAINFRKSIPQAVRDAGRYVILRQADIVSATERSVEEVAAMYNQSQRSGHHWSDVGAFPDEKVSDGSS